MFLITNPSKVIMRNTENIYIQDYIQDYHEGKDDWEFVLINQLMQN